MFPARHARENIMPEIVPPAQSAPEMRDNSLKKRKIKKLVQKFDTAAGREYSATIAWRIGRRRMERFTSPEENATLLQYAP